mmetsp:Transcript_33882/g.76076  ORF Transcript_33882/g.76076 Transcript_33882/m.76076 type:complete len:234 (-) Transcript_33882:354-1055(-)
MARAKVATIIAGIRLGNASQVRAHTNANQPLRPLAALRISRRLAHGGGNDIVLAAGGDLLRSALADEDRLFAPLHSEVLPYLNWAQVHLHDTCCKDILCRPQGEDELSSHSADQRGGNDSTRRCHEVDKGAAVRMANGQPVSSEIQGALGNGACWHWRVLGEADWPKVLRRVLGNRNNGRLLRVMPDVRACDRGSGGQLASGTIRLAREGRLSDDVVVVVLVLAEVFPRVWVA